MSTRAARVIAVAIIVFVCALPQTQARAKGVDTDPPSGIVPTTSTLAQVLAAHDKAVGKPIDPNAAVIEDDDITSNGLTGTYHAISYHDAYMSTTKLGPFVTAEGSIEGQTWSEDENGQIVQVQGVHERGSADQRALNDALTHPNDGVKLLGEVSSPVAAYVVEVNPPDGRREWIFYDKSTSLIDRIETVFPSARTTETYSDFKTRHGRTEAWSGHYSDGDAVNDQDWHITSLQVTPSVDPGLLAQPASRTLVDFPSGATSVKLPARIIDGRIIVTLTIGGKGYDFLLDSGSSEINVDFAAAQQMGLKLYGKAVGDAAGKFSSSESVIPEVDIGDLKMHDVAVTVLPYTEDPAEGTELVGLLGYDFIAGSELRIDYDGRSVIALSPKQYVPAPDVYVVPAELDDRIPVVAAQIGQAFGDHFIIDTGADLGYIFPGFVAAHPQDVADRGGGSTVSSYEPFMYSEGVGGETRLKPTQVGVFQIGGVRFEDWMVYTMPDNTVQQAEDFDGLIGYDFLRYFTVVFDYADSLIYLEPNDTFRRNATH